MSDLLQDLRYALRELMRRPGFAAVAVLTLALGIGAATSIFSVADAVLLRPLPYADPGRLVAIQKTEPRGGGTSTVVPGADFLDWRRESRSFEAMAAYRRLSFNLVGGEAPRRIEGASVSPDLFSLLGVQAELGRTLSPDIDTPQAERTAVLGHSLWRSHFGGDPAVVGQAVKLNDEIYTVAGVLPAGFAFPEGTELYTSPHYRVPDPPFDFGGDPAESRSAEYLSVVGRLRQGTTLEAAQTEMTLLGQRLAVAYPEVNRGEGIALVPLRQALVGEARPLLRVLLGAVGFMLLIACANVAHLLVVRVARREKEMAVRRALGAGGMRLVRQLLTESLVLALLGGLVGTLFALWGTEVLLALAPADIPRAEAVGMDGRVLAFTLLLALATGVLFGLAPVPQAWRGNLQLAIKEGAGQPARGGGRGLRRALVVGEVAISLVLLVGAGLTGRTFLRLVSVDPGFDPGNTLVAHLTIPPGQFPEEHDLTGLYRQLLERAEALPGVESVGAVLTLPMHWNLRGTLLLSIEGRPVSPEERVLAEAQLASPGYFRTLRIPLVAGRLFTDADREDAPPVALVNQAFVERYWPGEEPLGKRITWGAPDGEDTIWYTVVGVVGNTSVDGLDSTPAPMTYQHYPQAMLPFMTLVVRSASDPAALAPALRTAVLEVAPELPLHGVATLEEVVARSLGDRRFNMLLLGAFAAAALAMAAVGLYGLLSFSVAQRRREIGIRRALGALEGSVIRQVVAEGLRLVALGLVVGAVAGLALTRLIASQVYGIPARDPVSYGLGAALLLAVALVACSVPARAAARVDPLVALRHE